VKPATVKLNRDERASLRHAVEHLDENHIGVEGYFSGWYNGNKANFIKRHAKAKALLLKLIGGAKL